MADAFVRVIVPALLLTAAIVLMVRFYAVGQEFGYSAGWCEGRGGQWVDYQCVDSLKIRHDTTEAPHAER